MNKTSTNIICLFKVCGVLTGLILCQSCCAQERLEEFNGPFTSWANVKTRFGAKGDGKTDDTKAFQHALDSLRDNVTGFEKGITGYTTVFIPKGTYKITSTLVLRGKIGIRIIGEDPANTMLDWQGNDNDTILWANGSSYFSVSRISFDARGKKNMEGIGMHWKSVWNNETSRSYAPEQVEFADLNFKTGFGRGISGGTFPGTDGTGSNESEVTIKRCVFNECAESGILIRGFNALDYWIWDCKFLKCWVGVTSNSGNYHIYKSYFAQSIRSDVLNSNSYYTSVRFCFSTNAGAFSLDNGSGSNPFKRIFEGNTVTGVINLGIYYGHTGKITLLDNSFDAVPGKNLKFLEYGSWSPSHFDLVELNNKVAGFSTKYTIAPPSRIFSLPPSQVTSKEKKFITAATFLQAMPPCPPVRNRTIFDVPLNSTTAQVQAIINKATGLKQHAVVHFPFGVYSLTSALIIPQNSDIQLEGDGYLYASVLQKAPSKIAENGAALKILCPTSVSIKELSFQLSASERDEGRAIALINADQPGASILLDQLYCDNDTSLLIKEYDYTLFQKTNSFFTTGNYVSGGSLIKKGSGTMKVQCFGAQFANLTLAQNATFIARDCWWEGPTPTPLNLQGSGYFILDGSMIAPRKMDSTTIISVGSFAGKIAFMDMYLIGSIDIKKDNPQLQFLAWNINFYHKKRPLAFLKGGETYKGFFGGLTTQCFNNNDPDCAGLISTNDAYVNVKNPDDFVNEMTKELRAAIPVEYTAKPAGVTNFYLSRVSISERYKTGVACIK